MNKDGDCNMDNTKLAELLFPDVKMTPEQLEDLYPKRDLPEGAIVSRMAPSPTGFVHLGNLVQGLTSERLSHQSGGVLFLRVEDTDSVRARIFIMFMQRNWSKRARLTPAFARRRSLPPSMRRRRQKKPTSATMASGQSTAMHLLRQLKPISRRACPGCFASAPRAASSIKSNLLT